MAVIKRHDIDEAYCIDAERDLWLINELYEDDEGFNKNNWYVAQRFGKWQDWDTLHRVGSSYTRWDEAKKLAESWVEALQSS